MIAGVTVHYRTREIRRGGRRLKLGPTIFRLVAALLAAPDGIHLNHLVDTLWMDDPEGGPLTPRNLLCVLWCRYWKPLEHLGLRLERGRYNRPWAITDGWTPAERVAHLEAALRQAEKVATRTEGLRASLAHQVAQELGRISA